MLQSRRLRVFAESTAGGQKATVCCWTADDAANETARFGGDACEDASCLFLGYREGEIMLSVHDFDLLATKNKSYYADASTLCKLTGIVCDEEQSFAKLHRSVFMCAHLEKLIKCQLVSPHEVRFDVTFNFPYGALRGKLQKYFSSEDKGHFLLKEKFRNSAAVVCRACGDRVLELRGNDGPARFTGFLLMPHDDWRELVDCWSCHKDEFGHLAFKPYVYQPRKVYVGLDYFVFGADLLVSTASAAFGRCKCGKVAENVPINALNLLWVCADAGSCADEPVVYSHLSGSLLLMLKIVAMSRDNSSFRFVLINGDRTKFLLIWVLSVDCWTLNTLESSSSFEQTVKVWWKQCASRSEYDPVEFEHLELTFDDQFDECLAHLQHASSNLPLSVRNSAMDGFSVACVRL